MSGFLQALPFVLRMEGGYSDDAADHGGATNQGITQATYDAWRASIGQSVRSVRYIASDEVEAIYHKRYWIDGGCDSLPWPTSAAHFDACVNHGVARAKKMLQRALGVTVDGIWGIQTHSAILAAEPHDLLNRQLWIRVDFYYRISTGDQIKFLRGWLRRLLSLRKEFG